MRPGRYFLHTFTTMKTLVIVRHAESGGAGVAERDIDRVLTVAGKRDAAEMAALLKAQQIVPDWFYASNAKRARETADFFFRHPRSAAGSFDCCKQFVRAEDKVILRGG